MPRRSRSSTQLADPADLDSQIVVCEGTIDALHLASVAAEAGLLGKFCPVSTSGLAWSDEQCRTILARSPRAPVLAADCDTYGGGANLDWARRLLGLGRRPAIVDWPHGEKIDPDSWLTDHAGDPDRGLSAFIRRGGTAAPAGEVRPRAATVEAPPACNRLPAAPPEVALIPAGAVPSL